MNKKQEKTVFLNVLLFFSEIMKKLSEEVESLKQKILDKQYRKKAKPSNEAANNQYQKDGVIEGK